MSLIDQMCEGLKDWPPFTSERLTALWGEGLPRLASSEILKLEPGDPANAEHAEVAAKSRALADAYFRKFLVPGPCPACGRKFGFSWGICHGEGTCRCGYPGRAHHSIPDADGSELMRLSNMVLWYHPDELSR